ncbi:MBL fold metallo-hydrolase [Pseudomonas spirodelae]|uniref:MBL fold metallo-hydrolase n=1 Tax=Pseudomonas spirodelae TaxID=3101751 RepID=A0ABU5P606_9PSED|nr:MBL fold metallo-hydrolase [Pseudomonas sp. T5W1]MEA1605087.1 MBL fold metallo-hydrolase [Pseudomonas sp. T5W1]
MALPLSLVRQTLRAAVISCTALTALIPLSASAAPVAKQQTQVPGYYRMALGDFEVTALYDGYIDLDNKLLKGASAEDIQSLLSKMFLDSSNGVQTAVNAYLINTGTQLLLIDTGAAQCFGPTLGVVQSNLKASGYRPEQVDTVLLTHLHPDHACGLLTSDGKAAYPNATVYVPQTEADYWLSAETASQAPEASRGMFSMSQQAVAPYAAQQRLKRYSPDSQLFAGLSVVPSNGHTPGHSSYLLSSNNQSLLVWGDIVHSHAVQFAKPEVVIEFDSDQAKAVATRKKLFAEAARDKLWVAGAHMPFPGIGHVRNEGSAYAWVPVEFGPIRSDR